MINRTDVVTTVVVTAAALAGWLVAGAAPAEPVAGILAVAHGVPLLWRRRRPVAAFVATTLAVLALGLVGHPNVTSEIGPYVAAYAVGAYAAPVAAVFVVGAAFILVPAGAATFVVSTGLDSVTTFEAFASTLAVLAAAYLAGRVVRARREASDERTRRALAEERARIARELHDLVAHHVGVMVIQAGAGRRLIETDPERARGAFEQIERSGREALTAMPALLGALRTEPEDQLAPQPSLAALDDLVARVTAAGTHVQVVREGEPRPLSPTVDVSAYRIVQEALTNAAKHARDARVTVTIAYAHDAVTISVVDDGRGTSRRTPRSGHGLRGMRERVSLLGGELEAGPRPGGGFAVRARLPEAAA